MYDQYYELTGRPFQLTPDPRFYFESSTHRKALSYLGYGLAQGEGFIVITGEIGAGKTTLVRHLMETVDPGRLTAATIVTTQLEDKDLLHMVAESFGIAPTGNAKSDTLRAIEQFLHEEARQGRRCLLVVDEAQNLPTGTLEELRMLSNFQLGNQALLQIFLLGQPEFRDQLRSEAGLEQLRQRVIATHHLEAMQPDEVEPYIAHRLSKVGWTGRPDFTMAAIGKLFDATGGVPRKLNMLMTRVLLMGAVERIDRIDIDLIEAVLTDIDGDASQGHATKLHAAEPEAEPVETAETLEPLQEADEPVLADEPAADQVFEDGDAPEAVEAIDEPEVTDADISADEPDAPSDVVAVDELAPEEPETSHAVVQRFFRPGVMPPVFEAVEEADHSEADFEDENEGEPETAEQDDAGETAAPGHDEDDIAALTRRLDKLEDRVEDQAATIKRLVTLLLDYVEREDGLMQRRAA